MKKLLFICLAIAVIFAACKKKEEITVPTSPTSAFSCKIDGVDFSDNNPVATLSTDDIFYPKGQGVAEFAMYIYNRWGEEIFYSADMNQGWSGKISNEAKVMAGYYSYVIHITDKLGVDHTVKGKVLLN